MADIVDKKTRSRMMSGIRGKDTQPEMIVRRSLHARGFRYRLHDRTLPGKPDLKLPKHHCVILVHGCFWHRHNCPKFKYPTSNASFWRNKINKNVANDRRHFDALRTMGWRVAIVWECAVPKDNESAQQIIIDELEGWIQSSKTTLEIGSHFHDSRPQVISR